MAIQEHGIEFKVGADTGGAVSNLQKFEQEFKKMLEQMGKSPKDIAAFQILAKEVERGVKSTDELDAETRQLLDTYRVLKQQAKDRDFLGLQSHQDVRNQIEAVKQAYERLKASGNLTSKELAQAAQRMQTRIRDLERSTNGWLEALSSAKAELAAMAGSAAALGGIVAQAIEFEDAMAGVRKVVDGTDAQFRQLEGTLKDMATAGTLGASELAKIAAVGGQLGVPIDQLGRFTDLAQKMATAFDLGAEQAAQAIAKLANVFNLPIDNVEALSDAINTLGNNTAATEAQILDALTRIGGTATQFGLAADQAAALADAFIALGRPPEVAATAINAMLTRLQAANVQSKQFQDALGQLGLSAEELAASIRDKPQQALLAFLGTLQDLDAQSRAEILTRLFGQEHADEIAALVGSLDQYRKALGLVADQSRTAGATQREFEARMQTTKAQMDRLANAIEVAAVNLGGTLLPVITPAIERFADLTAAVADLVDRFPELARLATVMSTIAVSVGGLKAAFAALRIAKAGVFESMIDQLGQLRTPIPEVTAQLGKLTTAFNVLGAAVAGWEIGTTLRNEFAIVREAGVFMAEVLATVFESIRTDWEILKAVFTDDTIEAALARHAERAAENTRIFQEMYEDARNAGDQLQQTGAQAGQAAEGHDRLARAAGNAGDALRQTGDAAQDAGGRLDDAAAGTDAVAQALEKLGIDAVQTATGIRQSFIDLTAAYDTLAQSGETSAEVLQAAAGRLLDQARSAEELAAALRRLEQAQRDQNLTAADQERQYVAIQQKLDRLSEAEQKRVISQSKLAQATLQYRDAQMEQLRGAIRAAGTEAQLQQIEQQALALRQQGIITAEQYAEIKQKLADESEFLRRQLEQEADAQRQLNEATEQGADANRNLKDSTEEAGDAAEKAGEQFLYMGNVVRQQFAETSQAAADMFERWRREIAQTLINSTDFWSDVQRAQELVQGTIDRAQVSYDALIGTIQRGNLSLEELDRLAATVDRRFEILGEQKLEAMRRAIDDARQKLLDMRAEVERARDALGGLGERLRDELDRIEGNRQAIEERRFKRQLERIAELERQGGESVRRQAEEARRLAEELHRRKLEQIRQQDEERRRREAERQSRQADSGARTQVAKVIRVDFGGRSLDVPASQEQNLLDLLERFKKVT